MAKPVSPRLDPKAEALARDGVLNPHPEGVRDPLFNDNPFFDPKDLVQVRYEMVRRHQNNGIAITDVAETFGVSRPTFYKAQGALAGQGLAGLVPRQRGPKGGHKISAEVLSFVERGEGGEPGAYVAASDRHDRRALWTRCPQTKSGARACTQKKIACPSLAAAGDEVINAYERLRAAVLGAEPIPSAGLATMRREGMAAWLKTAHRTPVASAFHARRASAASPCRRREE